MATPRPREQASDGARVRSTDLRMGLVGLAAWAGGLLVGLTTPRATGVTCTLLVLALLLVVVVRRRSAPGGSVPAAPFPAAPVPAAPAPGDASRNAAVLAAPVSGAPATRDPARHDAIERPRAVASWSTAAVACLLVLVAVAGVGLLRGERVGSDPVAALAADGATVTGRLLVTGDPRPFDAAHGDGVVLRGSLREVTGRGSTWQVRSPVLVIAPASWADVELGATLQVAGRLDEPDDRDRDLAAVLVVTDTPGASTSADPTPPDPTAPDPTWPDPTASDPTWPDPTASDPTSADPTSPDPTAPDPTVLEVLDEPDPWWRATAALRDSLRDSVAHRPDPERVLVPALVAGDDAGLDPAVAEEFRATGLTHLLAVSGTNLTLLLGALLVLARTLGVRGRGLLVLGLLGVVGFVLMARTEPSVLRAAVMGVVGLLSLTRDGSGRAVRSLGVAVTVLLLLDPGLATEPGFALSVLATAGIVLLAPRWRDALARWMPRRLAEAIAVPTAAQLACTPVVAGLSGQVSLVAVAANLAAAPAVGPATVLGLLGGCVGLVWPAAGRLVGTLATWCVAWIVEVAHRGAALPTAAVGWGTSAAALALLTALSVALAWQGPRLVGTRARGSATALVLAVVVVLRPPTPGWPPDGWVLVACDVGQGDALVLRTAPGRAVLVDVGPDPPAVERCLDDLGVERVDLLVLTHFHADHVDGLEAVLASRPVEEIWVSRVLDPTEGAQQVVAEAAAAGVPVRPAPYAGSWTTGDLTLQVLWPEPGPLDPGPGDGSAANDASVVLLAQVDGLRLLLTGDVEPPGQASLARTLPDLDVDLLKVPHHGSRYQDLDWLTGLQAEVAVVSVGEDNDYGHPAAEVLDALEAAGTEVLRTDTDGAVALLRDGRWAVAG